MSIFRSIDRFLDRYDRKFKRAVADLGMKPTKGAIIKYERPNYWLNGVYAEVIEPDVGLNNYGNRRCTIRLLTDSLGRNPSTARIARRGEERYASYPYIRVVSE